MIGHTRTTPKVKPLPKPSPAPLPDVDRDGRPIEVLPKVLPKRPEPRPD